MEHLLLIILTAAGLSLVLNLFLKRHDLPPLLGYILAGSIITQLFGLGNANTRTLHQISEFGVAFLMFTIGLEFSLAHLKSMRREVLLIGSLQMGVSSLFFGFLAYTLFGAPPRTSVIIGSALALSSTAIVLKILNEKGEIHKLHGRFAFGILLFQDLAVIPILLMISILSGSSHLGEILLQTALSAAVALAILFFAGKFLVSRLLGYVIDLQSHELFVGTVLLVVTGASVLTHTLGFSYSLGAFFAGMLISETSYKYQVEADLVPFRDLLLGVFFVTVGMQIDPAFFLSNWLLVSALFLAILFLKTLLVFLVVRPFGSIQTAVKTAIALAQVGEFSFVVFELARSLDLISREINQAMIIAVVASMIATPFILRNLGTIASLLQPGRESEELSFGRSPIQDHVVVVGYGGLGKSLVHHLRNLGAPYIVVDHDRKRVEEGIKRGDPIILGNAAQKKILESVHVKDAAAAIIAIDDDRAMRLVSEAISHITKNANIVVKVTQESQVEMLRDLRIKKMVDEHDEVARILIDYAITCDIPAYIPGPCRDCESWEDDVCVNPEGVKFKC